MHATQEISGPARQETFYDAIIAGAGPVGLFLACELALAGCAVLVLERAASPHSPLKEAPFGIRGLTAPTIEALDRRGLLGELTAHARMDHPHQHAGSGARRQAGHFAGIPFLAGDIDPSQWPHRLPNATATSLIAEIAELESVLTRRASALGVEILRGLATTGLHQTGHAVTVHAGAQTFSGRWLVGCDGARSTVRKSAGFDFAGTAPEFTGYTLHADIADPEKLQPGRTMTATGMYLQSQPGYLVMQDFDAGAFHDTARAVTLEHAQSVLRRISGTDVTLNALHIATTWTDRALQATSYRRGRVLLAGDAAHIHSPLGGQGLNLGIGDAMNLGWKLAATIHGRAPEGLLDSYHAERHPAGARVLDWSRAQVAIMRPDPHARALNGIIRDLMKTRDGATYFAGKVWGVSVLPPCGNAHPLTGHSAPDFEFEGGARLADRMHGGQAILLDFGMAGALAAWAAQYGGRIQYIRAGARDRLGVEAVLIRPDGMVAWASGPDPDIAGLDQAAARWFVRQAAAAAQ